MYFTPKYLIFKYNKRDKQYWWLVFMGKLSKKMVNGIQHSNGFTRFKLHKGLPPYYLSIKLTINKHKNYNPHSFVYYNNIKMTIFYTFWSIKLQQWSAQPITDFNPFYIHVYLSYNYFYPWKFICLIMHLTGKHLSLHSFKLFILDQTKLNCVS